MILPQVSTIKFNKTSKIGQRNPHARTQKLPYKKISSHFDDFIDLGHTVRTCKIRSFFKISCISKRLGFT